MNIESSHTLRALIVVAIFVAVSFILFASKNSSGPFESVELGVATVSVVNGENGGYAIPASCPSYSHSPGACDSCSSLALRVFYVDTAPGDDATLQSYGNSLFLPPFSGIGGSVTYHHWAEAYRGRGYENFDNTYTPGCSPGSPCLPHILNETTGPVTFKAEPYQYFISWEVAEEKFLDMQSKGQTCVASGDWSGTKIIGENENLFASWEDYLNTVDMGLSEIPTSTFYGGTELVSGIPSGDYTYTLTCGTGIDAVTETVSVTVENGSCTGTVTSGAGTETCIQGDLGNDPGEIGAQLCSPVTYCGDGIVQMPNDNGFNEQCEGGSRSCTTSNGYPGTESCTASCTYGSCTSTGGSCGDGIINGPEVCDGVALPYGGQCSNHPSGTYDGGTFSCTGGCTLDFSSCTSSSGGGICDDDTDNDGDGLTDENDPGCWDAPYDLNACLADPASCVDDDATTENNCGNNICEAFAGENPILCPADCAVTGVGEE